MLSSCCCFLRVLAGVWLIVVGVWCCVACVCWVVVGSGAFCMFLNVFQFFNVIYAMIFNISSVLYFPWFEIVLNFPYFLFSYSAKFDLEGGRFPLVFACYCAVVACVCMLLRVCVGFVLVLAGFVVFWRGFTCFFACVCTLLFVFCAFARCCAFLFVLISVFHMFRMCCIFRCILNIFHLFMSS